MFVCIAPKLQTEHRWRGRNDRFGYNCLVSMSACSCPHGNVYEYSCKKDNLDSRLYLRLRIW